MSTYRLHIKNISRNANGNISAVAAAAYRAEEKLQDETKKRKFDYSKKNYCLHKEILLPSVAPEKFKNRSLLWNEIEKVEKRKDARLAREFQVSLPHELKLEQQKELVKNFCAKELVSKGMICDIAIHNEKNKNKNYHAHILTTLRNIEKNEFGKKNRDWNNKELVFEWRKNWEKAVNIALEKQNIQKRVSCLSNEKRGLEPTKNKTFRQQSIKYFQKVGKIIEENDLYEIKKDKEIKISFYPPEENKGKRTFRSERTKKYFLANINFFLSKKFLEKIKEKITLNKIKDGKQGNNELQRGLRSNVEKPRNTGNNCGDTISKRPKPPPNPSAFISKLKRGSKEAIGRAFDEKRAKRKAELERQKQSQKQTNKSKPSRGPRL